MLKASSFIIVGLLGVAYGFAIAPMGLSGSYLPFGNYPKPGKAGNGVSWSRNLDTELSLRRSLCPSVPEALRYQYRFDNSTRACYKIGDKGPCGENMIFFGYQTNAVYGECDCNYNDNGRTLIYDESADQCNFVFTRGPCGVNEWLTFDADWKPTCEPNKCIQHYDYINRIVPEAVKSQKSTSIEYVPYKGTCVPLGESCDERDPQWNSLADMPHEVQFVKGKLEPRCAPNKYISWRFPTPKLQCIPGGFLIRKSLRSSVAADKCHIMFEI